MAALIGGLVAFVVGSRLYVSQEGTITGSFALSCVCIWNGCFNSIQIVCREREILKREHRSGMHISSYIIAQMLYQMLLCLAQSLIITVVFCYAGVNFPTEGVVAPYFLIDFVISLFLITFAADMMAMMISCIVHTTTTAMTVMPFLLIFQLVFSGAAFTLKGVSKQISNYTISNGGIKCLASIGKYNDLISTTIWKSIVKYKDQIQQDGVKPLDIFVQTMKEKDQVLDFKMQAGKMNAEAIYDATVSNITHNWLILLGFALLFAFIGFVALKFIDRDKR